MATGIASGGRALKQWALTRHETQQSFEGWRNNLLFVLGMDKEFAPFLRHTMKWKKDRPDIENRGLTADAGENALTAEQKVNYLELMLGQIANFAPIIDRSFIIEESTCIEDVWQVIRQHYGFKITGGYFLALDRITYDPNEQPEDLYQRIYTTVKNSMYKKNTNIKHHGTELTTSEVMTPTIENFIVYTWLKTLHSELPELVKRHYGPELCSNTLASLKNTISLALPSLMGCVKANEAPRTFRMENRNTGPGYRKDRRDGRKGQRTPRLCPLCDQAGRPKTDHFIQDCKFLPENDRRYMKIKNRLVEMCEELSSEEEDDFQPDIYAVRSSEQREDQPEGDLAPGKVRRVAVKSSPHLSAFHGPDVVKICLDSGAESCMISEREAARLGLKISPNHTQRPSQADGAVFENILGECYTTFTWGSMSFGFSALVSRQLATPIIAGVPFLEANDMTMNFKYRCIVLADGTRIPFDGQKPRRNPRIQRVSAEAIKIQDRPGTIWPGDYLELKLPSSLEQEEEVVVTPRYDSCINSLPCAFPAGESTVIGGNIRIINVSPDPINIRKHQHLFDVTPTQSPEELSRNPQRMHDTGPSKPPGTQDGIYNIASIKVDPDNQLSASDKAKLLSIMRKHSSVFNSHRPGYNGARGPVKARVNMGPTLPPQRKGRVPAYGRDRMVELQNKMDDMENEGVFAKPEDVGVDVEYLNTTFLVNKPNGGRRMVTAFDVVAKYSKPQPALLPDVNQVLRKIAQWKYIIISDLASAYFQIPLCIQSQKYCGVATPYKGIRVYQRSAMGMPGSETALEELMCRVIGDIICDGGAAKLADDLYCGGNTIEEVVHNWGRILAALEECDLRLSASKTVVCPTSAKLLGWIWKQGTIQADPHSICALAKCQLPRTAKALRSFVGSYKALARVIPSSAKHIAPLDNLLVGKKSSDTLSWSEDQQEAFKTAQDSLATHQVIVLPTPQDELWLVTDAATRPVGVGSTLYVKRDTLVRAAGFFSCKVKIYQVNWLPCELEALAIAASLRHFSPYFIQTEVPSYVVTDSKPCVDAYQKLQKGEFSASPRVSTFLSTASRYAVTILHIGGKNNIPADFASRNPQECRDPACQVCRFVADMTSEPVINLQRYTDTPLFTSRAAWKAIQGSCPTLRRTYAHLKQGTRPSKKEASIRDVKAYLNTAVIASDGLLVIKTADMFNRNRERIIVPRHVVHGILTALHLKLSHPSAHQLKTVFARSFHALSVDAAISTITKACEVCEANKQVKTVANFSSEPAPDGVMTNFAFDVMRRARQFIAVLRETVTSYTDAMIIPDERKESLREAIVIMTSRMRLADGPPIVVRCDPAPGLQALQADDGMRERGIRLDVGCAKNVNKNPVAERGIQEIHRELRVVAPRGESVSGEELAEVIRTVNSRLRRDGVSAWEMMFVRDQNNGEQIPISDEQVIDRQHETRVKNHEASMKSKNGGDNIHMEVPCISQGNLIYVNTDRDKSASRPRYIVTEVKDGWVYASKFVGKQIRAKSYKLRATDCSLVPSQVKDHDLDTEQEGENDVDMAEQGSIERDESQTAGILPEILPEDAVMPDRGEGGSCSEGGDPGALTMCQDGGIPETRDQEGTGPDVSIQDGVIPEMDIAKGTCPEVGQDGVIPEAAPEREGRKIDVVPRRSRRLNTVAPPRYRDKDFITKFRAVLYVWRSLLSEGTRHAITRKKGIKKEEITP